MPHRSCTLHSSSRLSALNLFHQLFISLQLNKIPIFVKARSSKHFRYMQRLGRVFHFSNNLIFQIGCLMWLSHFWNCNHYYLLWTNNSNLLFVLVRKWYFCFTIKHKPIVIVMWLFDFVFQFFWNSSNQCQNGSLIVERGL